jgi:hypothetical protein
MGLSICGGGGGGKRKEGWMDGRKIVGVGIRMGEA